MAKYPDWNEEKLTYRKWKMYYKGFNKDMTCKGFQYEEGKEYHEEEAIVCRKGFHACEYPWIVLTTITRPRASFTRSNSEKMHTVAETTRKM